MTGEGRIAIITGGSGGIGKAIALVFAQEGFKTVIAARTPKTLEDAREEITSRYQGSVETFVADVSKPRQVDDLVEFTLQKFGSVDVLVNCAGAQAPIGLVIDVDPERWLETINTNLYGTFLCMRAVLPTMTKNRRGKIINFSGGGAVGPRPRFTAYGASKAAVVRLTESLAHEVSEHNIDINAVAPGAVNTRLLDEVLESRGMAGPDELIKAERQKQDGGVPREEVAALVLFLASAASDGLTGRLISLPWDDWSGIPGRISEIAASDVYAVRRIIPKDRGYDW